MRHLNTRRSRRGNMLIFMTAVIVAIVIVLLLFMLNYVRFIFGTSENVNALEAASLEAAKELARVVVHNDYYGFVSLSDYPPIGSGTNAGDQEPLPVFSINTVLGTARLDLIIANEMNNQTMIDLAQQDVQKAKQAVNELNTALVAAINGSGNAVDLEGNAVDIQQTAMQTYQENLDNNTTVGTANVSSFNLEVGWIDGGATTITPVPQPQSKNLVNSNQQQNDNYKAFINIPAFGEDFYFAGVGERASLVDIKKWKAADGIRPLSAVKAFATHTINVTGSANASNQQIESQACAIPGGNKDLYPPGQLNIGFPHGQVPGIVTIKNIFDDPQLKINPMPIFTPPNGDWPGPPAVLSGPITIPTLNTTGGPPYSVNQIFSMGFFDWLRSSKTKPRIDSVLASLNLDLTTVPGWNVPTTFQTYTFIGCPNDMNDPRFVAILNNDQAAQDAFLNVTTMADVWNTIPQNSTALQGNGSGPVTSNGQGITNQQLTDFWNGLAQSNQVARDTYANAQTVLATDPTNANAIMIEERAKWIILVSHTIASNMLNVSSAAGVSNAGGSTKWQFGKKLSFGPGMTLRWDAMGAPGPGGGVSTWEHDKVNMTTQALSVVDIQNGSGLMNNVPNDWFQSDTANDTSSFFFASVLNSNVMPAGAINTSSYIVYPVGQSGNNNPPPPNNNGNGSNPSAPPAANQGVRLRALNNGQIEVVFAQTPFGNIPVSQDQIYGVSTGAMQTGSDPATTWTAILRDQARNWGNTNGGQHAGQPSPGNPPDYINRVPFGGSGIPTGTPNSPLFYATPNFQMPAGNNLNPQPRSNYMSGGLSVEFQLRNPLILECVQGDGDNTNSTVPDIPPDLL